MEELLGNCLLQNATGWALMGHVKFMQGDTEEARDCYERTLSFVTDPLDTHPVYLRLASIYLQEGRVSITNTWVNCTAFEVQ